MVARATLPNKAGYRDAVWSSLPIAQINLHFGEVHIAWLGGTAEFTGSRGTRDIPLKEAT